MQIYHQLLFRKFMDMFILTIDCSLIAYCFLKINLESFGLMIQKLFMKTDPVLDRRIKSIIILKQCF